MGVKKTRATIVDTVSSADLVAGTESVHRADLVRAEGLAEQVDGRHLAAKDALLVDVGSRTQVALVERLERKQSCCQASGAGKALQVFMKVAIL